MTENRQLRDESIESMKRNQDTQSLVNVKAKELHGKNVERRSFDESREFTENIGLHSQQQRRYDESSQSTTQQASEDFSWNEISEVVESDFLISPGDIYPSRKVELKDAEISPETLQRFEDLCDKHHDAFSKNNQDIGKTQLIEMELIQGTVFR